MMNFIQILKHHLTELNKDNFDFVFYIAGVDIHFNDRLGKLKILVKTKQFYLIT